MSQARECTRLLMPEDIGVRKRAAFGIGMECLLVSSPPNPRAEYSISECCYAYLLVMAGEDH
jgi:hypothetical protein